MFVQVIFLQWFQEQNVDFPSKHNIENKVMMKLPHIKQSKITRSLHQGILKRTVHSTVVNTDIIICVLNVLINTVHVQSFIVQFFCSYSKSCLMIKQYQHKIVNHVSR